MKPTIIWLLLFCSLPQWIKAQATTEQNYVSGSDCKSLVIPYFQTKYKECLSLNGGVDCNQYVDFNFLEALQSACMADGRGISKLKLSKSSQCGIYDTTKAEVGFLDKYLIHIIIFSFLACLVIFTPRTGTRTLES